MSNLADRFRRWYEYERDCNAKTLAMLQSVPVENRTQAGFQRAVDKTAHLVAARRRWLTRLGVTTDLPPIFPKGIDLDDLSKQFAETEAAWSTYLAPLTDADLTREFEYTTVENTRLRWNVEGVLTQTFGHAWYHRGQVAMLVADLGGKAVDTDYIFWSKPKPV